MRGTDRCVRPNMLITSIWNQLAMAWGLLYRWEYCKHSRYSLDMIGVRSWNERKNCLVITCLPCPDALGSALAGWSWAKLNPFDAIILPTSEYLDLVSCLRFRVLLVLVPSSLCAKSDWSGVAESGKSGVLNRLCCFQKRWRCSVYTPKKQDRFRYCYGALISLEYQNLQCTIQMSWWFCRSIPLCS